MLSKRLFRIVALLCLISVLVGCAAAPTATPVPPTEAPKPTAVPPTAAPKPTAVPPTAVPPTVPPKPTEAPKATAAPTIEIKAGPNDLILATTTSTQDSGLLDVILPDFEKQAGVKVAVVAVGSGQAIKLGEDGNADVLLVHSPAAEKAFMEAGHGARREDVMYNDFVIVGPESDPAGIKGMTAVDAFKKLAADAKTPFVSRGDNSGTHSKEKTIWKAASIEPKGDWYVSAGQGMGSVLTMALEQQAYTLADRATYLAMTKKGLDLVILVEGDKALFNPYGVITVNPEKGKHIKAELATKFVDWIISEPTQKLISEFGKEEFGQALFTPDSAIWREKQGAKTEGSGGEATAAGLKVTGKVAAEKSWTIDELKVMPQVEAEVTNKKGEVEKVPGPAIVALLAEAKVAADATKVTFVAADGYTYEAALKDVLACDKCVIGFRENGGLKTAMTGFDGQAQVKDVVEIKVQ